MDAAEALADLWSIVGGAHSSLTRVTLTGEEPALPSSFKIGTTAQATIAAAALMASEIWRQRTDREQKVAVGMRHAAAEFRSERYLRVNGQPVPGFRDPLSGIYPCLNGGWLRPHLFPHEKSIFFSVLGIDEGTSDRATLASATSTQRAEALEQAANDAGVAAAAVRSYATWKDHPQGRAVATEPLISIEKIDDDAPQIPFGTAPERPLDNVRVLDLTHVIAGPVCGRTLAAHGANVLAVGAAHLPAVPQLVMDVNRGKRSCYLDLRQQADLARLMSLIREADVFLQSYRPNSLAARGLSPVHVAAMRPGIVYTALSAYGWTGPWSSRRGYDSLVQTATGFNLDEAKAAGEAEPKELPCQALDHASGYLMALGTVTALSRRAVEGGSWYVKVSLARTGMWLRNLGRLDQGFGIPNPGIDAVSDLLETSLSGFGRLDAIRHSAVLSETPAVWKTSSMSSGISSAAW